MKIIFEKSIKNRRGVTLPACDVPQVDINKNHTRQTDAELCELSELDVIRHFTELSRKNYGVDTNFYPLGSCTMKYNPKVCERVAALDGFASLHPMLSRVNGGEKFISGALEIVKCLENQLCKITGMDAFTLQPMAGAHGELTGLMIIAAHHRANGNAHKTEVLLPDESHGTNPSSAAVAGYDVKVIPTNTSTGLLDIEKFKSLISDKTAAVMLTNPNTLGLFNSHIKEIAAIAHEHGALLYYDGANLNAIMGKCRPGDADFDVIHLNLHKTFATPHGGGGPGSGPVGVKKFLEKFLPVQRVFENDSTNDINYKIGNDEKNTIGNVAPFFGNFGVCVKALSYILMNGGTGLRRVSEQAVLNANYIMHSLKDFYDVPYLKTCMHECVITPTKSMLANGVKTVDIAKSLIDSGFHPPTIYFPLIVKEAMMIEPTETESKETLDSFIDAMIDIAKLAISNPEVLHQAPITTPIGRLNEAKAAKDMDVRF